MSFLREKLDLRHKIVPLLLLFSVSCRVPDALPVRGVKLSPPATPLGDSERNDTTRISRKIFSDTCLEQLIDLAVRNNADVMLALQRMEYAAANFRIRKGALFPAVQGEVSPSGQRYGKYTMEGVGNYDTNLSGNIEEDQRVSEQFVPYYFAGLRSHWEIDLWGRLRQMKKSAYLQLLAAAEGKRLVITTLVSEIASRYYELQSLDALKEVIKKNITIQDSAVSLTQIQKEAGRTNELGVQQMKAQALRTKALLAQTERRLLRVENEINFLAGRFRQTVKRNAYFPDTQAVARYLWPEPEDVLRQRPDILEAEWQLQSSGADLQAAKAALKPALTLSPFVGYSSFNGSLLFRPESIAWGIVGGLSGPLLNRSLIRGNIKRADADREAAIHTYNKKVLQAFQELYSLSSDVAQLNRTYQFNKEESAVLSDAVLTSQELFKVGYASYLEVITAQRQALEAEINLIETKKQLLQTQVSLYRAVGGSW